MNTKFGLTFIVFAALILSVAAVSALSFDSDSVSLNLHNPQGTVRLTNNDAANQTVTLSLSQSISNLTLTYPASPFTLNSSSYQDISVSALTSAISSLKLGTYKAILVANGTNGTSDELTINVVKSFCKNGSVGNLRVTEVDIKNEDGDDDEEWMPLNNIVIEVDVENAGDDDINDIIVVLGFYDSKGKNQADELEFSNDGDEEIDLGDLNDDDSDTVTFEFKVPADLTEDDYTLVIKAFSDDDGESKVCADVTSEDSDEAEQSIKVNGESDEGKYIAFDNVQFTPTEATCGEAVTLDFDVYNIGNDDDADQDQVRVNLISKDLGINQYVEIKSGLDAGDKESLSFTFVVPKNLADKTYKLVLNSEYDYKKSSGAYKQESDEDYIVPFKVFGCNVVPQTQDIASISATLGSDAVAGKDLIVNALITNTGSTTAAFEVTAAGYDSWASESTELQTVTLGAGESREVPLTFKVNKDVSGEKSFVLNVRSGANVATKEIAVSIAKAASAGWSLSDSNLIWIIAGINIILILIIIIVAIRIARR